MERDGSGVSALLGIECVEPDWAHRATARLFDIG